MPLKPTFLVPDPEIARTILESIAQGHLAKPEDFVQEAVAELTEEEKQELADDINKFEASYASGTLEVYEINSSAELRQFFEEIHNNTVRKYERKAIQPSAARS